MKVLEIMGPEKIFLTMTIMMVTEVMGELSLFKVINFFALILGTAMLGL